MKKAKQATTAIVLALVLALAPTVAFAAPQQTSLMQLQQEEQYPDIMDLIYQLFGDLRQVTLTPEAMEIVLSDFDYLVSKILEVAPTQNIIYRRMGISAEEFFDIGRQMLYSNEPLPSLLSTFVPERWADAQSDTLYLAADYLYTFLILLSIELGGLGHMTVQEEFMVEQLSFALAYTMYAGETELTAEDWYEIEAYGFCPEAIQRMFDASFEFARLQYEIFNTPSVLWFYDIDPSEFDFDIDISEVLGTMDEDNITTQILEPGRIAYLRIASFINNMALDSETLFPFYMQIQDYEHLIIDIRGNGGGWANSFPTNVISMLIGERISYTYYEFFMASDLTADFFINPSSMGGGFLYDIVPISQFLQTRNMPQFNPSDLALLDYAIIWSVEHFPAEHNIPFEGKIWLLVDGGSASASELAANASIGTGFATVVGEPTAGITGVVYTFAALPNTGILFRIDLGYTVDRYGRSIEEFGVIPQVLNSLGVDALETVLALIEGNEQPLTPVASPTIFDHFAAIPRIFIDGVEFVSIRLMAESRGYSVAWDANTHSVIATNAAGGTRVIALSTYGTVNDNGTVLLPLAYAQTLFAVPVSPIVGTWVWDYDADYIYTFNSDGTGQRGFIADGDVEVFTWEVVGTQLNINLIGEIMTGMIRYQVWNFTIVDNVLTLESAQLEDIVFSYIRK